MIPPEQAWDRIVRTLHPLPPENVPRRESVDRALARPLEARVDVPGLDMSAMDGYAVSGDILPGDHLPVLGSIAAGDSPGFQLPKGSAVRIMTGAPMPSGADRVVQVELTDAGKEIVTFKEGTAPGSHIRFRGEVLRRGQPLLDAGALLTPGALGLLATHGIREVQVPRRPTVAFLATGNEVVPPESEIQPGQLRDSHTDFLLAAGRTMGIEVDPLGIAPDDTETLRRQISAGLSHDVLLLGGGVSTGEYDLVEDVLTGLGCRLLFDKVAVQPGKPLVAAVHEAGMVFGLPGNPAAVMVCFWLFVRPYLRRLQGLHDEFWHGALRATLTTPLPGAKAREKYLTTSIEFSDGRILAAPHTAKGSHDVAAYGRGTALVRIPAHARPSAPGDPCEVLPLVDWQVPSGWRPS